MDKWAGLILFFSLQKSVKLQNYEKKYFPVDDSTMPCPVFIVRKVKYS